MVVLVEVRVVQWSRVRYLCWWRVGGSFGGG